MASIHCSTMKVYRVFDGFLVRCRNRLVVQKVSFLIQYSCLALIGFLYNQDVIDFKLCRRI